jgi:2-dehydropantoate 2-reductase
MTEIHQVAILGAGAMGAYFASRFAADSGFTTTLLADGERKDRLNAGGLIVNGQPLHLPARSASECSVPADLILVAVKHHHLADSLSGLDPLVGENTVFLSVMNGLDSEEMIAAKFGSGKVLYAISLGIDAVREGNVITYTKPGVHYFGEARNEIYSGKVLAVQEAFDRAGVAYQIPDDMLRMLWWKFMFNVGINQASSVLGAPYGVFHTDQNARGLMESLMREVLILAQASEVNLTEQDLLDWYPVLHRLSPLGKTSMLQDFEAGRKSELEIFSGRVIQMGQKLGIPTPVNRAVNQILQVYEAYPCRNYQ